MEVVNIRKDQIGRLLVSFPYDPLIVAKVKAIEGRRWHHAEKHWSFPNTDGMLQKILKVFGDENVEIDPSVKGTAPDLQTEQSGVVESGLSPGKHKKRCIDTYLKTQLRHPSVRKRNGFAVYTGDTWPSA